MKQFVRLPEIPVLKKCCRSRNSLPLPAFALREYPHTKQSVRSNSANSAGNAVPRCDCRRVADKGLGVIEFRCDVPRRHAK